MQILDWNWFFSAAAQSAGAIVGIFAAFIITKIVNNQGEFSRKNSRIDELLVISDSLKERASSRYFSWYSERKMDDAMKDLEDTMVNDQSLKSPEEYFDLINFPVFVEKAEILEKISETIAVMRKQKEHKVSQEHLHSKNRIIDSHIPFTPITNAGIEAAKRHLRDQILSEGEAISQLIVETRKHAQDVLRLFNDARKHPESSSLVAFSTVMVSLLFFAGIIYPLSFLPLTQEWAIEFSWAAFTYNLFSVKGLWLALLSVLFMTTLIVFFVVNHRLKYNLAKLGNLKRDSKFANYSEYFRIIEENRK